MTGRPLPSSGSLGSVPLIPRYYGPLRLPAALPLRLRFLRLQVPPGTRFFAPLPERMLSGKDQGTSCPAFPKPLSPGGNDRVSQVPGGPLCLHALLSDPGRIRCAAVLLPDVAFRLLYGVGSRNGPFRGSIPRPADFPVYASQDGLPHHHATLGSGRQHAYRVGLITHWVP